MGTIPHHSPKQHFIQLAAIVQTILSILEGSAILGEHQAKKNSSSILFYQKV